MNTRSSRMGGALLVVSLVGLLAVPEANAQRRGGHSGGGGARAPHVSAPRQTFRAPRMPHATAPRGRTSHGHKRVPATGRPAPTTREPARTTGKPARPMRRRAQLLTDPRQPRDGGGEAAGDHELPSMQARPVSQERRAPCPPVTFQTATPTARGTAPAAIVPMAMVPVTATVRMEGATGTAGPRATTAPWSAGYDPCT